MQPYFFPYAGYFRLFAGADIFAVFDCVQFPRRGWVHRNRLCDRAGSLSWLTLPLRKGNRDIKIVDLQFTEDAIDLFQKQWSRFPCLSEADPNNALLELLRSVEGPAVDYLIKTLRYTCDTLDLSHNMIRTSGLDLDPELKGQDRIIEVVKRVGGTRYINLHGGSGLYEPAAFAAANIDLYVLSDFVGGNASMLQRLLTEPLSSIRQEIYDQLERKALS